VWLVNCKRVSQQLLHTNQKARYKVNIMFTCQPVVRFMLLRTDTVICN